VYKQRSLSLVLPLLFFIFLGFSGFSELQAQDGSDELNSLRIVGTPAISPGDIIADRDDNRDANGNLSAGLRVKTDLTGLQFRSNNGILKAQQLPGATLLYLQEGERVVTVYKDGYPPYQIVLSDEGIDLESGKVWEVQVTGNQKSTTEPVQFNISPENTTLFIDGEEFQIDGTVLNTELTTGDHFIQLRKDRHAIRDDSISVSASVVNSYNYTLDEINPIPVLINSTPQGASIYLNDSPGASGVTPKRVNIYPGDLKIRLTLPGYSNVEDEFEFTGENDELSYNLQEYIGLLSVNTDPANAAILIDDEIQSSSKDIRLIPGPHRLEVRASGYDPYSTTIDIVQGDSLVEDVNLGQITGNLFFIAQQPEMNLTMAKDGQVIQEWQGSKTFRNLPVGKYLITAKLQNFQTRTQEFELRRDDDRTIDFDLTQIAGQGSFALTTLFEDANVVIQGDRYRREFNQSPVNVTALPYGEYTVTVKKAGFETIKKDLEFRSLRDEMTIVDEFQPKSKSTALVKSLFIPGLGHGHIGKSGRGLLYFIGSAAAIGYTIKSMGDYSSAYDTYQTELQAYNNAGLGSDFPLLKQNYEAAYDDAISAQSGIEIGLYAFAAVKGIELIDLLLQRSGKKMLNEAKLEFNAAGGNGLSMRVNF